MSTPIRLQQPHIQTQLPAHEQLARRKRAEAAALPGIPGTRSPRQPRPAVPRGRKTFDTRILSTNF